MSSALHCPILSCNCSHSALYSSSKRLNSSALFVAAGTSLDFHVSLCLIASFIVPFVKLHRLVNALTIIFDSLLSCSPLYARLQCEDHIIRIGFITTPREVTTELAKLNSFIQRHKRVVSTTLILRLRGMFSADPTIWHGEVEAAVGVFEA